MITEGLLSLIFPLITAFFDKFPEAGSLDIDVESITEHFDAFFEILKVPFYVLPMETIITVITITISIFIVRIIISLIKTIWALLPVV